MKHHKKVRIFDRDSAQRKALLVSLARSLMIHGRIVTTIAKAKELRPFVEKLVTIAKADTVSSRRLVASRMMNDTDTVAHLHSDIAPKFKERAGGYTRITKLGVTQNPLTDSALIEFVQ